MWEEVCGKKGEKRKIFWFFLWDEEEESECVAGELATGVTAVPQQSTGCQNLAKSLGTGPEVEEKR